MRIRRRLLQFVPSYARLAAVLALLGQASFTIALPWPVLPAPASAPDIPARPCGCCADCRDCGCCCCGDQGAQSPDDAPHESGSRWVFGWKARDCKAGALFGTVGDPGADDTRYLVWSPGVVFLGWISPGEDEAMRSAAPPPARPPRTA